MKRRSGPLTALALLWACSAGAAAPPQSPEQHWADILTHSTGISPQWLQAGDTKVLALYTAAQPSSGAIIILHNRGTHPDWPAVIHPLRQRLPEYGWSTLSVQMPVLGPDTNLKDYAGQFDAAGTRIDAALNFAHSQGASRIILMGYGLGATMAADYLARHANAPIQGFVAVSMASSDDDPRLNTGADLDKIRTPVLDVYGSLDRDEVIDAAAQRLARHLRYAYPKQTVLPKGPDSAPFAPVPYRQIRITGADHDYTDENDVLVRRVRGWLDRLAAAAKTP